jgi:integrase
VSDVDLDAVPEQRRRQLRIQRRMLPGLSVLQPEHMECVARGLDYDEWLKPEGEMKTSNMTRDEAEQIHEVNRAQLTLNDIRDRMFPAHAENLVESTRSALERNWDNHVREHSIANKPVGQVTEEDAQWWINTLPLAPDGARKLRNELSKYAKRAVRDGHARFNVFEGLTIPKRRTVEDDPTKFYHPSKEYPLILEHAKNETAREFFGFCMGCGPRSNEGKAFRWEDIDLEKGKITFRYGRAGNPTKGGKPCTVDLLAEAELWLRRRIDRLYGGVKPKAGFVFGFKDRLDRPYKGRNYNFGINDTLKAAGIDPQERGLYGFRHGFCTALAHGFYGDHWTKGEAQTLMRHSKMETTEIYYHVLDETLHEKAQKSTPITVVEHSRPLQSSEQSFGEPLNKKRGTPARGAPFGRLLALRR